MSFTRILPAALTAAFCIVSAQAAFAAGLTIALVDQTPDSVLMGDKASFEFPIRVNLTAPGGKTLDPGKMEITATLEKDGKTYPAMRLASTGHDNQFGGEITLPELGSYVIDVNAHDPASGATAMLKVPVAGLRASDYPDKGPAVILGPAAGKPAPGAARRPAGDE